MSDPSPTSARLLEAMEISQRRGAAGEDASEQLRQAARFASALSTLSIRDVVAGKAWYVDLGSGGGVPGLALAVWNPGSRWLLVESRERRADLLHEHVRFLELGERVTVANARAEELGRDPEWRQGAAVVVARGFGPPAATAECAAPFLMRGGHLLVSEPPDGDGARWSREELTRLGMVPRGVVEGVMVLRQEHAVSDEWPRAVGRPRKSPLF